jgi:hypothetical protein
MDLKALSALIASVAAVVAVIGNAFGVLDKLVSACKWVWHRITRRSAGGTKLPTKTVVALTDPRINALYWGEATIAGKPGMQVVGDLIVTNITAEFVELPVGVLRYRRRWWDLLRKRVRAHAMVKDVRSRYSGRYGIPPKATTDVRVVFIYSEPERPEPGDFVGDVALVDQFGNHHWLRRLRFKHPEKMHS